MCEQCNCSTKAATSPVLKPRQGRPYIHIDGSVRYQAVDAPKASSDLNQHLKHELEQRSEKI